MKIAFTYDNETNTVFQHFGRTEFFYIFDTEINEEKVIERYGKSNLELHRLKRGIQEILSHSKSLPFIPGYVLIDKSIELNK